MMSNDCTLLNREEVEVKCLRDYTHLSAQKQQSQQHLLPLDRCTEHAQGQTE